MGTPTILATDDSVTVRKLIEISLSTEDCRVHFAVDGRECLRKARELKPDLILLDYILPDMRGQEVCQALLKSPATQHIPVLLISGNGAAIRQTYESIGNVADYLTKPFAPNVLQAVVGHLLAKAASSSSGKAGPGTALSASSELSEIAGGGTLSSSPAEAARVDRGGAGSVSSSKNGGDGGSEVTLRCSSELVACDKVLEFLAASKASGRMEIEISDERVVMFWEAGQVVFVSSSHPKKYCAGAAFPFRDLPPSLIAAAVAEQQQRSTPFFVTVHQRGRIPAGVQLPWVLRVQGELAVSRAVRASRSTFTLVGPARLPAEWASYRLRYGLPSLLLSAYRGVDDWQLIESLIPNFDLVLSRAAESERLLQDLALQSPESALLRCVDGRRSLQELSASAQLPPFQVARTLFPFVRLGVLLPAGRGARAAQGIPEVDEDDAPSSAPLRSTESLISSADKPVNAPDF